MTSGSLVRIWLSCFDPLEASYNGLSYTINSADNKCKEESAKLLGCLIRSCERLVLPYIAPIHKVEYSC